MTAQNAASASKKSRRGKRKLLRQFDFQNKLKRHEDFLFVPVCLGG